MYRTKTDTDITSYHVEGSTQQQLILQVGDFLLVLVIFCTMSGRTLRSAGPLKPEPDTVTMEEPVRKGKRKTPQNSSQEANGDDDQVNSDGDNMKNVRKGKKRSKAKVKIYLFIYLNFIEFIFIFQN